MRELFYGESKEVFVDNHRYVLLPILMEESKANLIIKIFNNHSKKLCNGKNAISGIVNYYVDYYNGSDIGEEWTFESAKIYLENFIKTKNSIFLTKWAIDENDNMFPVAFIGAHIKPYDKGYSVWDPDLFVIPKFQRLGISKELIKALFKKISFFKYDVNSFYALTYDNGRGFPVKMWEKLGIRTSKLIHISGNINEIKQNLK